MWKIIRISLLLVLLICVGATTWLDRVNSTSWKKPLYVGIFPMNADGSAVAEQYVNNLRPEDFAGIEEFFAAESFRYDLAVTQPVRVVLYPPSRKLPPMLAPNASALDAALWSLKLRWFARGAADVPGHAASNIRIFVLYHDPASKTRLPHSHGLQKGLVGIVHAFADRSMRGSNNIVIAHETLHTVGATDKYDLGTGKPAFPAGYADPERKPLYPQAYAEVMAGQRALSEDTFEMPGSLDDVIVGPVTAAEIGWVRN